MAATGSELRSGGSGRRGLRTTLLRRLSLRARLALLYGAFFLVIVAAVLGGAYALVAHDIAEQAHPMGLPSLGIPSPSKDHLVFNKSGIEVEFPVSVPLDRLIGPRYSAAQLAKARAGAQAMTNCMHAHGARYFPTISVGPVADGHGLDYHGRGVPPDAGTKAYKTCFPLLNNSLPAAARTRPDGGIPQYGQLSTIGAWASGLFTSQSNRSLRTVRVWLGIALGVMAGIAALLAWLLAGRAVRPLRTMTSKAQRITEENLHERLAPHVGENEFGELASTFDDVLGRLERAFDAQKRFVANASHELRTPVTVERALLELTLADPDADAETLRRTCERVLNSAKQQQGIVEALLALARTQTGTGVEVSVDLATLTGTAIALREERLHALRFAAHLRPAPCTGDPTLLEQLIANLIENAIVHNVADDGWIRIETGTLDARSWIRVSNSGPQVPESMVAEIFEPFRRLQDERSANAAGLGLGLSIVQGIAEVHDATVDARPLEDGGLEVQVSF